MANRYWVGSISGAASTDWAEAGGGITNWGSASATADNASVPTSADAVIFDSGDAGNCTIAAAAAALSVTCTGYAGVITHNNSITLSVYGSVTLVSGGYSYGGSASIIAFIASGSLTTAGNTLGRIANSNTKTITLQDSCTTVGAYNPDSGGILDMNEYNFTCASIHAYGSNVKTFYVRAGTMTITSDTGIYFGGYNTNFINNAGGTLSFTSANPAITLSGTSFIYWGNVESHCSTTLTLAGSSTSYGTITVAAGCGITGAGRACGSFSAIGTSGSGITITGNFSDTAGTNTVSYCTITNSAVSGGATWEADATCTDGGGNSGWTFLSGGDAPLHGKRRWGVVG